uniref:BTB domain-containing protein n=1 Tax=Panagrellus redivivus TaxID=6233 RepID=A0A7E4ZZY5_PANRE
MNDELKQALKPVFETILTNTISPVELDAMITFGDQSIEVSRKLLTMISAVFRAMFAEVGTNAVEFTEADFDAAEEVIHWCHGNEANYKSVVMIIQMIRFAYKYNIKAVVKALEPYASTFFNITNFCTVAKYA